MPFSQFRDTYQSVDTLPIEWGYTDDTRTTQIPFDDDEQFREVLRKDASFYIEHQLLKIRTGEIYNAIVHAVGRNDKTLNAWEAAADNVSERKSVLHLLVFREEIHRVIDAFLSARFNQRIETTNTIHGKSVTFYRAEHLTIWLEELLRMAEDATRFIVDEILLFETSLRLKTVVDNIPLVVKHTLTKHSNPYSTSTRDGVFFDGELEKQTKGFSIKALHNGISVKTTEGGVILDAGDEIYTDNAEFYYGDTPLVEPDGLTRMVEITGVRSNVSCVYGETTLLVRDGETEPFIKADFDNDTKVVASLVEPTTSNSDNEETDTT